MDHIEIERTGDSLCSVVDLWDNIADVLKITKKQAAEFVEKKFQALELVLWVDNEYTGLWEPCDGLRRDGQRKDMAYLLDAWNSAESNYWTGNYFLDWKFLKLTPEGFDAIQNEASKILDHSNAVRPATALMVNEDMDPSDLPPELDAANMAFRAVFNGYGDKTSTMRNRLIDYLEKHYPHFKLEQVQRIATVANPDKSTGRKNFNKE